MLEFFKKLFGRADINKDGKVDAADAKVVVEVVTEEVKVVAEKAKTAVKKVVSNAKSAKKTASKKEPRKPTAQ
jgi:hypothetical protein